MNDSRILRSFSAIGSNRLIGVLAAVAGLLVVLSVVLSTITLSHVNTQANQNTAFVTCVSDWANRTAERTSILTGLSVERQDSLDLLIRDFALAGSNDPAVKAKLRKHFFGHLHDYIQSSDAYRQAVLKHPLPKSPRFACTNANK